MREEYDIKNWNPRKNPYFCPGKIVFVKQK